MLDLTTLLVVLLLLGQAPGSLTSARLDQAAAEFPPQDAQLWSLESAGLTAKLAKQQLAAAPDSPETLRLVARAQRLDDVLAVLRTIVERQPRRIPDAFEALGDTAWAFRGGDEAMTGRREAFRQIVADAEKQLPALPREDAARAARVFLNLESELTPGSRNDFPERVARFIEEYRGTEAALLAQVDAISASDRTVRDRRAAMQQRLDALEAFARAHPGSAAGAKAVYQQGFEWHTSNTLGVLEPRGADPIGRFTRVLAIVQRLESGEFPECEWVRKAPDLLINFFFPREDSVAPESAERMIAAYETLVRTHFALRTVSPDRDGIGYVVTTKLPDLYARHGDDRVLEASRFLGDLEKTAKDPSAARYLRALFYRTAFEKETPDETEARAGKMRAELAALSSAGTGLYNRAALASLASIDFAEGRYPEARAAFEKDPGRVPGQSLGLGRRGPCGPERRSARGSRSRGSSLPEGGRLRPAARDGPRTRVRRARTRSNRGVREGARGARARADSLG